MSILGKHSIRSSKTAKQRIGEVIAKSNILRTDVQKRFTLSGQDCREVSEAPTSIKLGCVAFLPILSILPIILTILFLSVIIVSVVAVAT